MCYKSKLKYYESITRVKNKYVEIIRFRRNAELEADREKANCENGKTRRRINKRARLETGAVMIRAKEETNSRGEFERRMAQLSTKLRP